VGGALLALASLMPGAGPVARGAQGLVVVADTTYVVRANGGGIGVTIDAVATSYEPDTPEGKVYYTGVSFAVPAGASGFAASSDGVPLAIRVVESADDYTVVQVSFSRGVFHLQSYPYQVTFELVDAGGEAGRDLRIGRSVVALPVWLFGDDGTEAASSVTVVVPSPFEPTWYGEDMIATEQADGSTILRASTTEPSSWFAYLIAERPGIFVSTTFELEIDGEAAAVRVRAWDDDPGWGSRMRVLMTDGLPVLQELIGLPWPVNGELKVEESATRRLGEYAGVYNRVTELITVRYDADAIVALHEAAHAWFNQDLFRERWIGEAWAEFYAVRAAEAIGEDGEVFDLTDAMLEARIPLNNWGAIATEDLAVEDFAYAATYQLAELIVDRTDIEALQAVWRAAEDGEMSYQPLLADGPPVVGVARTQPGWQRLLDLLEERTGAAYDDLWAEWVVSAGDRSLLEHREDARARHAEVVAAADDWELPEQLRYALSSWEFEEATAMLNDAAGVIGLREEIAVNAERLSLTPPDTVRRAFEADEGLAVARDEALAQIDSLVAIDDATTSLADEVGPVEWVGLLLADPAADLDAAREAWESGDSDTAASTAAAAQAVRDGAEAAGRDRLLVSGGGVLVLGGATAGLAWRRARRTRADRPDFRIG
jgi:hypothetical protein